MPGLGAVARGVDAVVARAALMVVDAHGAARPELDPGVLGQPDGGLDARRHHDVVGVDRLAPGPDRARRPERVEQDLLDLRPDQDAHAEALGRVLHVGGHVGVERAHDLRRGLDQRRGDVALDERLGHLEADVAAADDDDVLVVAAARQRRAEALGGVDGADGLARLGAGDRRRDGLGPGGVDELVEGLGALVAGLAVEDREAARVEVDRRDLGAHVEVSPFARCSSAERLMRRSGSSNRPPT